MSSTRQRDTYLASLSGFDENKPQWGTLIAATLGLAADGFDLGIMSYLLPYVQKDFGVSLGVASFLLLAATCTRWLGALLFGAFASRFGRKPLLIASVATVGAFTLLSGLAPSYGVLLGFRLIFGLGVGGVYATAGALIREAAGKRGGLFSGIMIFGWFGGGAISPIFFYLFLPTWGWRGVFFAESIILLLIPYLAFGLKESRIWLASKYLPAGRAAPGTPEGREAAAEGRAVGSAPARAGSPGSAATPNSAADAAPAKGRSFWALFGPTFIGTTLMLVCLEYGNFFSQSSSSLLPTFLTSIHLSVGEIALIGSVSSFIGMPGSLIGGWLCDLIGRKRTFRILFCIIWIPVVVTFTVHSFPVIFIAWGVFGLINGALGGSLAVFETEQYPTDLRSPGYGFAHNLGSLGGAFGTTIAAFLAATLNLPIALIAMTIFGVLLGLLSMFFAKETAGRSLLTGDIVDPREAERAGAGAKSRS